ncbi:MAG: hypothetical protein SPJ45_00980 [Anaerovoracaceae bacterium]|nr:hypothetical protein [Bacillota bacterium]MDY5905442.1 hypothetical protein [Anaerovoracaceae bacterium]
MNTKIKTVNIINGFSDNVIKELKTYVYRLIDPRNGNTFYVGKGNGNRVFDHIKADVSKDALSKSGEDDDDDPKLDTIREIHAAGLEVIHVIHRHGMDDETALTVEAALIDCYPGLTNKQNGHGSNDYGVANALELEQRYSLDEYDEPKDFEYIIIKTTEEQKNYLIENGNAKSEAEALYQATRRAWKLNLENAGDTQKYPYVFASVKGVIQEVYKVKEWKDASEEGRIEFEGAVADKSIRSCFINKRLPEKYMRKGMASPALYSKNLSGK